MARDKEVLKLKVFGFLNLEFASNETIVVNQLKATIEELQNQLGLQIKSSEEIIQTQMTQIEEQ